MVTRYAELILRYRWFVVALTFVAVFMAAKGAGNLAFTNDYRAFFAEENPQLQAFEKLQNTYDKSDNVMFLLTPKEGTVFEPRTLEAIAWLTEEAWQTPYSNRVDSITNFQHTRAFEDDLEVADLIEDPMSFSAADLAYAEGIAQNEPQIKGRLLSADSEVTGINVNIQLPGKALTEVPEVAQFVRALKAEFNQLYPDIDVKLSGIVMMNNAFGESAQRDMATLIPLMFLIVIVTLAFMLWNISRSFTSLSATVASVLVIFMSILSAMGAFGWSGGLLTGMTVSAPTIILTMCVADCVHLLISFFWGMRHGKSKHEAMVEAMRINMMPIFITSVTTAIGFLSMNFSEVPPIGELGNIVAIGVMVAFVLSVSFLPALVMILPVKVKAIADDQKKAEWPDKLAAFVINHRKSLLAGGVVVTVLFLAAIPRNEINDEFVKYFDKSMDFRTATDYASDRLIGPYTIEYSLQANSDRGLEGAISEPAFLAKVDQFVDHLEGYDEVSHVFTLTDTMKRLNKNMHGDDDSWYRLPNDRELAAQYLLLYEMSLPYGLDLNNQIDVSKSATRVTVNMDNLSTNEVLALEKAWAAWLHKNAPEIEFQAASTNLMFAHIGYRNAHSLVTGTIIALFAISMIMVFALRSLKLGFISLIPNLIPAGLAFGVWGLIDGQVGMSVSIVAGMTLGIVVDDSVHFLSKYLRARREKGLDSQQAIQYAFSHVGKALLVTTVVLVAGFMMLTLSTFKINSDMGLLTAITITAALIVDFLLLPPLLMLFSSDKKQADAVDPLPGQATAS
ncbi:efflux RND transporter permease subunit [Agaribacterium haliotis]|uniref:efflux RND transporter permease subunit n=1 Tax=Agaribacterium haliotis TaxID=2013869 RepID=UPI000BB59268|nr:MMPL family transporter [Agaribacterium haliotis]